MGRFTRPSLMTLGAGVALAAAVACGDTTNSAISSGGTPIALEDVPELYAESLCAAYENCVGALAAAFSRSDECVTARTRGVADSLPSIEASIDDGKVVYDGTKIQACVDELEARSCEDLLDRTNELCDAALDGTVELGDDCISNIECQGAAFCQFDGACPGTCSELGGSGDDCEDDDQCDSGLVCNRRASSCVEPAGDGEDCDGESDPPCALGFVCLGAERRTGTSGSCMPIDETFVAGEGDDCSVLEGPLCEAGLSCVLDDIDTDGETPIMSCKAPVDSGDECQIGFPNMCPDDEYCDANLVTRIGECQPLPEAGDACGVVGFDQNPSVCEAYAVCVNGTCRAQQRLDGSCDNDAMCYTSNCVDGRCAASNACE
jgi:hypothetical protein